MHNEEDIYEEEYRDGIIKIRFSRDGKQWICNFSIIFPDRLITREITDLDRYRFDTREQAINHLVQIARNYIDNS